jgi:hypothetical protein
VIRSGCRQGRLRGRLGASLFVTRTAANRRYLAVGARVGEGPKTPMADLHRGPAGQGGTEMASIEPRGRRPAHRRRARLRRRARRGRHSAGTGGGDRAALRRAIPPGAKAQTSDAVAETAEAVAIGGFALSRGSCGAVNALGSRGRLQFRNVLAQFDRMAQTDPNPTFTTSPAGGRVGQKAAIRTGLTPPRQSPARSVCRAASWRL